MRRTTQLLWRPDRRDGTMRHFILAGLLIGLAMTLFACKDLLTQHDINLDGVNHGEKLYSNEKNCTACHGINLNGNGNIPSCYSCHDALWSYQFHTRVRGGVGHRNGRFPRSDCSGCHGGSSLEEASVVRLVTAATAMSGRRWRSIQSARTVTTTHRAYQPRSRIASPVTVLT